VKKTLIAGLLALCTTTVFAQNFNARVPEPIRKAGVLRIGTSPTYPPLEYKDPMTQKLMGLDIDLGDEIARRMGLKAEWSAQSFDQLINSLDTDRIDMGASGMTDIPQRREKVDFVDYFSTGTQIFTSAANEAKLKVASDVCGKDVAVNRNGIFYIRLQDFNRSVCVAKGLPDVRYSLTDKTADARLQIIQGRAVAAVMGVDAVRYLNESTNSPDRGTFTLVGDPIAIDVAGFGFAKSKTALRDLVADVVTSMMADGSYAKIFDKWQLPYAKMTAVGINGQPRAKAATAAAPAKK
jgi:polar amino acid transport system substrate-binding protein